MIAKSLYDFLETQAHNVNVVSTFRTRWIYWKPWLWPNCIRERRRIGRGYAKNTIDLWFTYHSYYKAPDLLGPPMAAKLNVPYVIFQGIYSTKRKRDWRTRPGFVLNQKALCAARHVFTNKLGDLVNIRRLLPEQRITYIKPGLYPGGFSFNADARRQQQRIWDVEKGSVVLSAAMFRPGVKADGLACVIRACGELFRAGQNVYLVIAGDGKEKSRLTRLADMHLPGRVRFVGKIPRSEMYRFYSAGDVFAFPGIRESLGMVFLEAQACGLPVVAFANGGIPEVVRDRETGFLVPLYDTERFVKAVATLLNDRNLRRNMGESAKSHVERNHNINKNYQKMEKVLQEIVGSGNVP
jgi:glycosyltransferase involved in cell wall biosynthesis